MPITIVTAAESTDLTTLSTVKEQLGISGTTQDNFLTRLIKVVSQAAVTFCQQEFAQQRIKETIANNGTKFLVLSRTPVTTVHAVTYKGDTVDASDYYVENTDTGLITNKTAWNNTEEDYDYEVEYTYGYVLPSYSGTQTLPYDIEQAVIETIKSIYLNRSKDSSLISEEVPNVVKKKYDTSSSATSAGLVAKSAQMLTPYRRFSL